MKSKYNIGLSIQDNVTLEYFTINLFNKARSIGESFQEMSDSKLFEVCLTLRQNLWKFDIPFTFYILIYHLHL